MSKVHLITGYKGEEHIQSADQGSFNASFFGGGEYVMEAGNQFEASIMNNNTVRILDGDLLMQGRHIRIEPETYEDITITTGTAGVNRIDLIVMQYSKDTSTDIESAGLVVVKGTETEGTAVEPEYTSGNILSGATFNQMPLYRVKVEGVVLTEIEPLFTVIPTYKTLAEQYAAQFEATITALKTANILDTVEEVEANTQENMIAGALALKEFESVRSLKTYTNVTQLGLTLDNTLDEIFSAMPSYSQLVILISQGKSLGGTLPDSNTSELIVTKENHERAIAVLTQYAGGVRRINHCYGGAWKGWKTLAISASNQQVRFQGINLSASDIAYIYTDDDNINFRYKTSTGSTAYANIRSIHGLLESVGSTLHSEKPVNETIVADGAEIVSLTIPSGGKWIITAYAGGHKILLKTDETGIYKHGINPTVYMSASGGVIRMINKSGNSITVYADITHYYIHAIRIG